MIRTYTINGMTCEGCVAKVTYLLEQHSNISLAKIELKNNTATLTVEKEIAVDELRRLLKLIQNTPSLFLTAMKTNKTNVFSLLINHFFLFFYS